MNIFKQLIISFTFFLTLAVQAEISKDLDAKVNELLERLNRVERIKDPIDGVFGLAEGSLTVKEYHNLWGCPS